MLSKLTSLCLLLTLLLGIRPAVAFTIARPTETEHAQYKLYYAGIMIGKLGLLWEADAQNYKLTFSMKTTGLMRLLKTQRRTAEIVGKRDSDRFTPIHYHASVIYPHKQKSTDMSYENGILRDVISEPAEEIKITQTQMQSAVDPITGLLELFNYMRGTPQTTPFTMIYFDGKRLSRGYAVPSAEPVLHCMTPCSAYRLSRIPLSGFKPKELADYAKGEPPLIVFFKPDSQFPLFASIKGMLGTVTLVRE